MSELKVDKVSPRSGNYVALNTVGMKNIIINGDMSIAQRGTSATELGNGDAGYHTVDRYLFSESGSPTAEFTQTQDTDVPTGQGFATSLKMDCTTAQASIGADDSIYIEQRIEGQNLQYLKKGTSDAESLTISFWVKSSVTGDYSTALYDNTNSRVIGNTYTISTADTWEKKTITFAGDTTGTLVNTNVQALRLWFALLAGTNRSNSSNTSWQSFSANGKQAFGQTANLADTLGNEWYITGIQLEAGTTASDFEFLPVDVNLQRCQRYFYKFGPDSHEFFGYGYATNNAILNINLPTSMRTAPSFTTSGTYVAHNGTNATSTPSFTANTATTIMLSPAASMTVTQTHPCRVFSNTSGVFSISAEL
jgi:hypothetical protein